MRVYRFEAGDDVGERANFLFERPTHGGNGGGVEAGSRHLSEIPALRRIGVLRFDEWEINALLASGEDDLPRGFGPGGDAEFACEDVHGAKRQEAKPRAVQPVRGGGETVDNFVECAVAAGGDDRVESFLN